MELEESAVINELKSVFSSENESAIHDAIAYIHENGTIKMLPLLFDLLETTTNKSLKEDIYNCLIDTKDSNAISIFLEKLKEDTFINEKKNLLSVLWQTNLDFSKHCKTFTDILISDTYENAIEAFSIFENNMENISNEDKEQCIKEIETAISNDKTEKTALLNAVLNILQ
ncbi:MAG: hypothetical protein MJ198_00745 [Bacteroidales bacterium]|nr:hypothetical protein [Bacteroidales bacterium]